MPTEITDKLNRVLDFLETNIDENHCREVEKRHLDALSFKAGAVLPLSFSYFPKKSDRLPFMEAFNNSEAMLYNELHVENGFGHVVNSVKIKDDYPLHIRCNYGIILSHCIAGGAYKLNENDPPWAIPMDCSIAEYRRKWEDKDYDIKNNDLIKKVCETYQYMANRLSKYPKCSRNIRLSHPDMQGLFGIAQMLFGDTFFLEMYDNPEDVHWLMGRITGAFIELFNIMDGLVNNYTAGKEAIYIHGGIYPGRVLLKNDTATAMISEEHYAEFCRPYDEKIAKTLGNVCIHYCGITPPFLNKVMKMPGLSGLNLGNPSMQDVDAMIRDWNSCGIPFITWGNNEVPQFLWESLHGRELTGLTLSCIAENVSVSGEIIKRYREKGLKALAV